MSPIVVIGGINMDLHLFDVHVSAGQAALVADRYLAEPGGKGANVARAVARLGAEVRLVGRVGDDEFGHECLRAIAADGVDTSGVVVTPETPTGFVAIQLDEGRHRSVLYAPGANETLTWKDVQPYVADSSRGDIVVAQAEIPIATLDELADHAVKTGLSLFLDPTPPERVKAKVIASAEVITPDRLEAAALAGRVDTSELWAGLVARELLTEGARRVVIKLGAAGAIVASQDGLLEIPTLQVEIVDETGAGDVFIAALAVARDEDRDWPYAISMANVAAALSVSRAGLGLPDRATVDEATSSFQRHLQAPGRADGD